MDKGPRDVVRWASVAILVAVYLVLLALGDSRASSGSDGGGKAATARVMADAQRSEPDIGYWAEDVDPDGVHHPIVNTGRRGDQWVQATSVPFSIATARLWGVGGAPAALLLPVAGGVLAAVAARRLARGMGGTSTAQEVAFWMVGLAGPVGFYALDLWEHAPAAGLVLWVAAVLVDPRGDVDGLVAGLAAGAAVVLRAETALVLLGLGAATLLIAEPRRVWLGRPLRLALAAIGAVIPVAANVALERTFLQGDLRGGRAASLAGGVGSQLAGRLSDAALETGGPFADERLLGAIGGLLLAVCAIGLAAVALGRWRAPGPVVRLLVVLGLSLYLGRLLMGIGFVPGMLAVAPLAAAGLVAGVRRPDADPGRRLVATGALISLPLIWLLQWQGNHAAQWGGRYLLATGALLVVVGTVAVFDPPTPVLYRKAMIGLSVLVGLAGLGWHVQRTAQVGRAFDSLAALPAGTTVVAVDPNLLREGGAWYEDGRWLNVVDPERDLLGGDGLADALELDDLAVVLPADAPALRLEGSGFVQTGVAVLDLPGGPSNVVLLQRR